MSDNRHKNRTSVVMLSLLVAALLAVMTSGAWPLGAASGQTIPWPTATPTPVSTDTPMPTNTLAPRPTWTRAPTRAPEHPTVTMTPEAVTPTFTKLPEPDRPTQAPQATPTELSEPSLPSPSPSPMEQRPSLSPTPEPGALVFEVLLEPRVAGPGDLVHFLVQVANVGRGPARGVGIEAVFPVALGVQSVDCDRCTASQQPKLLTLDIGRLASGEQAIASVSAQVMPDVWPGQTLGTRWQVLAEDLEAQGVDTSLLLPWAELPATGWVEDHLCITHQRGFQDRWQKLPI